MTTKIVTEILPENARVEVEYTTIAIVDYNNETRVLDCCGGHDTMLAAIECADRLRDIRTKLSRDLLAAHDATRIRHAIIKVTTTAETVENLE